MRSGMRFRLFSDSEARSSTRERKVREEANKEVGGEVYLKCKNCNGTGLKYFESEDGIRGWAGEFCEICGGTGYVDWLEAVIKGTGMVL